MSGITHSKEPVNPESEDGLVHVHVHRHEPRPRYVTEANSLATVGLSWRQARAVASACGVAVFEPTGSARMIDADELDRAIRSTAGKRAAERTEEVAEDDETAAAARAAGLRVVRGSR